MAPEAALPGIRGRAYSAAMHLPSVWEEACGDELRAVRQAGGGASLSSDWRGDVHGVSFRVFQPRMGGGPFPGSPRRIRGGERLKRDVTLRKGDRMARTG